MSNHYVLRLKLMQCYVNYISVTRGKNDGSQIVIFFFSPVHQFLLCLLAGFLVQRRLPATKKASFSYLFIHSFICISIGSLFFFNSFFKNLFILFFAALGLRCCVRAFSSCSEQGLLFVAVCKLLIAVASFGTEHEL